MRTIYPLIFLISFIYWNGRAIAVRHEPHLHSEVKIVDYEGPLSMNMLSLFKSAEIIEFVNCNFTEMPEGLYSKLPKLRKLYCYNVTASNVHHSVGKDVSLLEEFYYALGEWDEAAIEVWNSFHNLKKLVITDYKNAFAEIKANSFNETKLQYLEISNSGVEKIDAAAFVNLDNLEILKLDENKLKTIPKETLEPLKKLKTLSLSGNMLETFESSQLPNLPQLENLDLSSNPLKSLNLDDLKKFAPKLKNVQVIGTFLPEEQENALKKLSEPINVTNNIL